MLCQKCQQRPATVFFSQTVGNETTQSHLCEVCAQEQTQAYGGMLPFGFNPFTAMTDFVNQFMNWGSGDMQEVQAGRVSPATAGPQLQCPHCGYQLSTFRQNGRLGCTRCYEAFKTVLEPLISSIHGNVRHVEEGSEKEPEVSGSETTSPPARESKNPGVQLLRQKLAEAVQKEKYEEAARLRDEIHKLENS